MVLAPCGECGFVPLPESVSASLRNDVQDLAPGMIRTGAPPYIALRESNISMPRLVTRPCSRPPAHSWWVPTACEIAAL
jgi:hypothetical protein